MFQWINRVGYPTVIDIKIDFEAPAYTWELYAILFRMNTSGVKK